MGFSKNDFEKVDLRIKKITEQTVEQIEIDSELPPTIEQLEDNNRTYVSALSKGGFSIHTNSVIMIARC